MARALVMGATVAADALRWRARVPGPIRGPGCRRPPPAMFRAGRGSSCRPGSPCEAFRVTGYDRCNNRRGRICPLAVTDLLGAARYHLLTEARSTQSVPRSSSIVRADRYLALQ